MHMEEKILIESRPSKMWRMVSLGIVISIFAIALLFWGLQILAMREVYSKDIDNAEYLYYRVGPYGNIYQYQYNTLKEYMAAEHPNLKNFSTYYFDRPFWDDTLVLSIVAFTFLGVGLISIVMYFAYTRSKLSITEMNIRGNTLFGKEVVLPLHMVSGYSTSTIMSKIFVSTASGIIKFYMLDNYREICEVLKGLLNERQKNTETVTQSATVTSSQSTHSNADELKKYKELLDNGVITAEEFEAKKRQLLGL